MNHSPEIPQVEFDHVKRRRRQDLLEFSKLSRSK